MTTETSKLTIGDRVKVIAYDKSTDNDYVGKEGLIVERMERPGRWYYLVLLDNDPNPRMEAMLGGLPCHAEELEAL